MARQHAAMLLGLLDGEDGFMFDRVVGDAQLGETVEELLW